MPREDTQFKPGNIANPNGRPKGTFSITELIRNKLQEVPPEYKDDKKTYADLLVASILHKGIIEKEHTSQKLVMNYIDGLPQQNVDITSDGKALPTPILAECIKPPQP